VNKKIYSGAERKIGVTVGTENYILKFQKKEKVWDKEQSHIRVLRMQDNKYSGRKKISVSVPLLHELSEKIDRSELTVVSL